MQTIRICFNNLSLYKKILLVVTITLLCSYIIFFLSIHIVTARYEKELYKTNAQLLHHVSSTIETELQIIETVSFDLISDTTLQDNLMALYNNPNSNRTPINRRNIYDCLYPYTFHDNYIKSINIILEDGTNICMGNTSDIGQFDMDSLSAKVTSAAGRMIWAPARQAGSSVAGARLIRQLKFLELNNLASQYIIVDMEKLIQDALKSAGYPPDNSNFILLDGSSRIYPETPFHDELYGTLSAAISASGNSYTITSIDGEKEFIIAGAVPYTNWNYLYFRDYNPIFHNIQSVKTGVLILSACFALAALLMAQSMFRRILKHLDFLVEKIQHFGKGDQAPADDRAYNYENRLDEIGQLHVSFDQMTKSVKVLRDENYDKQLLLRDATIKMLQQQINPHFLYNTLDTINWMAQKYGADDISVMVRSLGNLFRASITGQGDLILLADELSVLDNYIQIQRIRFKDRLNFELVMPEDISHIYVPKLCIQPLVENSLKHAMEYTAEVCTIRVTIHEQEQDYNIRVANTGSRFEEDLLWKIEHKQITPQGSGVGLVNIDSRLKLLYGDHYGLTFYNTDEMAIVMLSIPKEREVSYAEINDRG